MSSAPTPTSSRLKQQADLLFAAGQLFGPLLRIVEHPENYDLPEQTRIFARFFSEAEEFRRIAETFCIRGEPGHQYLHQFNQIVRATQNVLMSLQSSPEGIAPAIRTSRDTIIRVIISIPISIDSTIHEARTPFSTLCVINDLLSVAAGEIIWLDRYFDGTIFHRHLRNVPIGVKITLVTYPDTKCTSTRDKQRYGEFIDMSRLFAKERGPSSYRLVVSEKIHARWLQCGDKLINLGDSIKELGNDTTFTISRLDSTPENLQTIADTVSSGIELFGPANSSHP